MVVVDSGGSGIEPTAPMAASSTVVAVDGRGNDAPLPPPPMMMTAILAFIALALALPWTRMGWQGKGRAVMHLIRCCHANPWLHVPLALEYMEHVVTTMSEMSAVMTGREYSRGLEILLMLVCKKCKLTFWKEGVYVRGNYWDKDVQWTKGY